MGRGRKGSGVRTLAESIEVRFTWNGKRCSENLKLKPTPGNVKFAEKLVAKIKQDIESGLFQYQTYFPDSHRPATPTTFRDYSSKWLAAQRKSKSTMSSYRAAVDSFWNPLFGDRNLSDIRYSDIAAALATTKQTGKTINNYLVPLRGIFNMAKLDGLITSSPAADVKNVATQKPEPDPLLLFEVDRVLDYMGDKYPEQARNYFEFAFFTGLRTSELFALTWGDIDWNAKTCRVDKAFVEGELKATKTNKVRYVDLNSRALTALTRQKAHTFLANGVVFHSPATNAPYSGDQVPRRAYWIPTLKALGMRSRDAYQTRHTYCTLLLMQGVNPAYVAQQLGHASVKMTLERYFKWIPGAANRAELGKLEALFGQNLGLVAAK